MSTTSNPSGTRKLLSRLWQRRWVRILTCLMVVTGMALAIGGWRLSHHYAARAATIDLSTLREPATGTAVLDRRGEPLGSLYEDNRGRVPVGEVPRHVIDALIATEDARFYQHRGVDYQGIGRAFVKNVTHLSVKQGGSTITQQLARQAFKLKGRTLDRKLLECFVARRIEQGYTKAEILEFYLNRIYLGHGFYGIGAAARGYFGKEVQELTLEEGAVLVGIIKAPVPYSPFKDPAEAKRVRDLTLKRMHTMEFINGEQLETALSSPVKVLAEKARLGRQNYVVAAVEQDLEEQAKRGQGGPWKSIRTTVDAKMQAHLDAVVKKHVARVEEMLEPASGETSGVPSGKAPLQAAAVIIDNATGEVLATCGGRDFGTSPFDRARQGQRPAGTAFLPLTYAMAFSLKPELADRLVLDGPLDNRRVMIGGAEGLLGEWGSEVAQPKYEGYLPASHALYRGKTGATVRVAVEAGLEPVQKGLQQCGFTTKLQEYPGTVLGNSPVTLTELARAYATLLQDGRLAPSSTLVTETITDQGQQQSRPRAKVDMEDRTAPLKPEAAQRVRQILVMALQKPEFRETLTQHQLTGRGLAGWGGTAHGFTDAWFAGGDQHVTCAVWMGYDEPRKMKLKSGEGTTEDGRGAWAHETTFPLWAEAMVAATGGHARGWTAAKTQEMLALTTKAGLPAVSQLDKEVLPARQASSPEKSAPTPLPNEPATPREPALVGSDPYQAYAPRSKSTGGS